MIVAPSPPASTPSTRTKPSNSNPFMRLRTIRGAPPGWARPVAPANARHTSKRILSFPVGHYSLLAPYFERSRRSLTRFVFTLFCTFLQPAKCYPQHFQQLPHSLRKKHPRARYPASPTCGHASVPLLPLPPLLPYLPSSPSIPSIRTVAPPPAKCQNCRCCLLRYGPGNNSAPSGV